MPAILQTEMTIKNLEEKLSLEFVKELNVNNTKTLEMLKTTSHTADTDWLRHRNRRTNDPHLDLGCMVIGS